MDKERLNKIKDLKKIAQEKNKDKSFKNMSRVEKDFLLETMAKMLGLIKS